MKRRLVAIQMFIIAGLDMAFGNQPDLLMIGICFLAAQPQRWGFFKFAIPIYGCGFLPDSDGNQGIAIKPGKYTEVVNQYFDGSAYFQNVKIPTFWVNGTNDTHFPMPSTQMSSRAVRGPATIRYELRMRHGHGPGWEPNEIYAFADSVVNEGTPLIQFGKPEVVGKRASVSFTSAVQVVEAKFYYTLDGAAWPERLWEETPATLSASMMTASIPAEAVVVYFSGTDEHGLMVSSEFFLTQ